MFTYILGVTLQHDTVAVRRMMEAGVDDVLAAPCGEPEMEMRLAVAEGRIGPPIGFQEAAELADRVGEIQRNYKVQRAFLEGLLESAPEGVVILDESDRVVRINAEFTRVFGYTDEEAVGRPLDDLIVPDDMRDEASRLDEIVRHGERIVLKTVRRHKDGHLVDVSVLAKPIDVNAPVGAFGIYRDITEENRREAALRASEARYRALFDQSPVGVFLCDKDLRVTHCNEYLTRIVGAPYEEIVGAELRSLKNSRLLPGVRAALRGEPAFYEGPYRTRLGKQLHVSVQYAPLRSDGGRVIGGIGVLEDISDRLLADKQLRAHAAEMERVNFALRERTLELEGAMQARSRLYSAMNHELRTPISAVLLYQELLIAGSLGPLNEDQRRALDHSHTATRHLLDLVSDILSLSKLEAGKVSIQPVEVHLRTLLRELQAAVKPLTERYGSPLRLELGSEVDKVVTDPQRVRQILLNFLSNAAKYGQGRPIDLRCHVAPKGEVVMEVADQGIGIDQKDLNDIFEEFVQLETAGDEGTGLGLAISRRLAELIGARLEVESQRHVGSKFRLVLPANAALRDLPAAGAA